MIDSIRRFELNPESHEWSPFKLIVKQRLPLLKDILSTKIQERSQYPDILWNNLCYGMQFRSFWKKMAEERLKFEWDTEVEEVSK